MILTRPLYVHEISLREVQIIGDEVVLDSGVHLHDVAALPSHVQIYDAPVICVAWTWLQQKHMCSVLEWNKRTCFNIETRV